jgi:hypothetical protein
MTVKELELQVIEHIKGMATLDGNFKNLRDNYQETKEANFELFGELRSTIAEHKVEAAELNLRLSLAEREIVDLKVILERSRSFRWALVAILISVVLSSTFSAVIAFYVKSK